RHVPAQGQAVLRRVVAVDILGTRHEGGGDIATQQVVDQARRQALGPGLCQRRVVEGHGRAGEAGGLLLQRRYGQVVTAFTERVEGRVVGAAGVDLRGLPGLARLPVALDAEVVAQFIGAVDHEGRHVGLLHFRTRRAQGVDVHRIGRAYAVLVEQRLAPVDHLAPQAGVEVALAQGPAAVDE